LAAVSFHNIEIVFKKLFHYYGDEINRRFLNILPKLVKDLVNENIKLRFHPIIKISSIKNYPINKLQKIEIDQLAGDRQKH